jgi:hypothetical protein
MRLFLSCTINRFVKSLSWVIDEKQSLMGFLRIRRAEGSPPLAATTISVLCDTPLFAAG